MTLRSGASQPRPIPISSFTKPPKMKSSFMPCAIGRAILPRCQAQPHHNITAMHGVSTGGQRINSSTISSDYIRQPLGSCAKPYPLRHSPPSNWPAAMRRRRRPLPPSRRTKDLALFAAPLPLPRERRRGSACWMRRRPYEPSS